MRRAFYSRLRWLWPILASPLLRRDAAFAAEGLDCVIDVGCGSGALDRLLEKVADFQDAELDERMQRLSTLIEPVTVLLLGLVVGALVLSLYLPVFQMGQIL